MIVEVPFLYSAQGRIPGSRSDKSQNLIGSVPVRIRELTSQQAPVVARCTWNGKTIIPMDGRIGLRDHMFATDYRMHDGNLMRLATMDSELLYSLWCPVPGHGIPGWPDARDFPLSPLVGQVMDGRQGVSADVIHYAMRAIHDSMKFDFNKGHRYLLPVKPGQNISDDKGVPEAISGFARITSSNRDQHALRVVNSMSRGAALVEGFLYVPSLGPCWSVENDEVTALPEAGLVGDHDAFYTYAPDERGLALSKAGIQEPVGEIDIMPGWSSPLVQDEMVCRSIACDYLSGLRSAPFSRLRHPAMLRALADIVRVMDNPGADASLLAPAILEFGDRWHDTQTMSLSSLGDWPWLRSQELRALMDDRQAYSMLWHIPAPGIQG